MFHCCLIASFASSLPAAPATKKPGHFAAGFLIIIYAFFADHIRLVPGLSRTYTFSIMEIQQFHDCRADSFDEMVFIEVTLWIIYFYNAQTKNPAVLAGLRMLNYFILVIMQHFMPRLVIVLHRTKSLVRLLICNDT